MRKEKDFEDFLKCLNKYKVKYCIVGGFAVSFYGKPRYTDDMDILVYPEIENSRKIKSALKEFGVDVSNIEDEYFVKKGNFYQIGVAPVMIHIINILEGVDLNKVFKNLVTSKYGSTKTYFVSRDDLIKNKRYAARKQDLLDVEVLEQVRKKK